jgi:hypothetical protein
MTPLALMAAMTSAGALALAAAAAHAQQAPASLTLVANVFTAQDAGSHDTTRKSSLEWNPRKGRWGLKLGVEQHTDRVGQWDDIQPGVFYRLTPRLHIGGAVSLAPDPIGNSPLGEPQPPAPRVRLETTFKF